MIRKLSNRPAFNTWVYHTEKRRNIFRKTISATLEHVQRELAAVVPADFDSQDDGIVWRRVNAGPEVPGAGLEPALSFRRKGF